MLFLKKLPKLLRWILSVLLVFLLVMTLYRLFFFWKFNTYKLPLSGKAFFLGLRYDLRFAGGLALAMLLLSAFPFLNPFRNRGAKKFWNIFLPFIFLIALFFYAVDFYHYDYLHQRLNATVLNYLADAGISFTMVWQTYPLLKVLLILIVAGIGARLFFGGLLNKYLGEDNFYKRKNVLAFVFSFLFFAFCVVGNVIYKPGQYPLRWSDAFTFNNDFKSQLSLNPFQSFLSTLKFRQVAPDVNVVRENYALMSQYLGITQPDSATLNFKRDVIPGDTISTKPNIVLVICESFSAYKSSMYGNPLNTTPYFNEMCKGGVFFDRCFTPAYGTARGVWATVTGIPDVANPSTASRNPNAVNQHTIINDFGYNNFYFIGGSATWANLRGLLTNNINGLNLYEQGSYTAADVDVWGISDKNLFLEANKILKQQQKPFFAVIQTADNHRPYTIPAEDKAEFKLVNFPKDSLRKYGFESNDEMNAFRYTDFCFQQFMEAAKKESYFTNTIFVFVGDHGIRGSAGDMFPKVWTEQGLSCEHVPLLFFSPKYLQPKRAGEVCSQVDILPSIASLAGIKYTNTTIGRNLFDSLADKKATLLTAGYPAFIMDHDNNTIGLVTNEYYFLKSLKDKKQELFSVKNNLPIPQLPATDSIKNYLGKLTSAYYETANYLLYNNKAVKNK